MVMKYVQLGDFTTQAGAVIPQVRIAYEMWGAAAWKQRHPRGARAHRGRRRTLLVARTHRAGSGHRHRQVLRHLHQRPGWLFGIDGPRDPSP